MHVTEGSIQLLLKYFSVCFMQVMVLLQVVVHNAASRMECHSQSDKDTHNSQNMATNEATDDMKKDPPILDEPSQQDKHGSAESSTSDGKKINDMFLQLPQSGLSNLCQLLGRDGYYLYSYFISEFL